MTTATKTSAAQIPALVKTGIGCSDIDRVMSAVEPVLRRLRTVVGTAGLERLGLAGVKLSLRRLLFDGAPVPTWHRFAACRGMDREVFFPPPGPHACVAVQAAKRVCRGCPVRAACLADVLAWEQPSRRYGVAGGLSATERHRLHRQIRCGGGS